MHKCSLRTLREKKRCIHHSILHELDVDGTLKHVFWANGVARFNYSLHGDVLSFDTTYDTNRYKMIFASFTELDNYSLFYLELHS